MNRKAYFLGVDGGQSHTTALVAEASGRVVGIGHAGPSNHTLAPGGRERLERALTDSIRQAAQQVGFLHSGPSIRSVRFRSAHLAMTGEPRDKLRVVRSLLCADHLVVGHDAPAALCGALAGGDGIVVLAGTGSVAYGQAGSRKVRIGGRGYLFADQGSGFAMARDAVSRSHFLAERKKSSGALGQALMRHFRRRSVADIIEDYYRNLIARDQLAAFSSRLSALAQAGDPMSLEILDKAACDLAEMAHATSVRLCLAGNAVAISYSGGVFGSRLFRRLFSGRVAEVLPQARVQKPRFGPEVGALLLAFEQAGRPIRASMISAVTASLRTHGG